MLDRWDRVSVVVVGLAVAAVAICTPSIKDEKTGAIQFWWLIGAIVAGLAIALLPMISAGRAKLAEKDAVTAEKDAVEREVRARALALVDMNEALDPIIRALAAKIATSDTSGVQSDVLWLVLKTAKELIGPDTGVRSCYFDLQPGPPKRLVPTDYRYGRMGSTRSEFVEGSVDGDAAIELVESGIPYLCPDTAKYAPPGWGKKSRDYKTFISVGVVAANKAYGMLTVDALNPGDLKERDMDLLTVMAGLVAIALALAP